MTHFSPENASCVEALKIYNENPRTSAKTGERHERVCSRTMKSTPQDHAGMFWTQPWLTCCCRSQQPCASQHKTLPNSPSNLSFWRVRATPRVCPLTGGQ